MKTTSNEWRKFNANYPVSIQTMDDFQKIEINATGMSKKMKEQVYKITHHYSKRPEYSVKVVSKENPTKFAVYVQFMAEEWFDESICLSNLVIADVLIKFYGCRLPTDTEFCERIKHDNVIDMYHDRECLCGDKYYEMMKSDKYPRSGLKEYLQQIQKNGNYLGELTYPQYYTEFQSFKNLSLSEQEYVFKKMQSSIEESDRTANDYFDKYLHFNREWRRYRFTLHVALLYLFNRNDNKDEILSNFIQDALICTNQCNQVEDMIKLLQEHYALSELFKGNLIDNEELEKIMISFLRNNSHNIIGF